MARAFSYFWKIYRMFNKNISMTSLFRCCHVMALIWTSQNYKNFIPDGGRTSVKTALNIHVIQACSKRSSYPIVSYFKAFNSITMCHRIAQLLYNTSERIELKDQWHGCRFVGRNYWMLSFFFDTHSIKNSFTFFMCTLFYIFIY